MDYKCKLKKLFILLVLNCFDMIHKNLKKTAKNELFWIYFT